ncbi:enoyl-CoA hydratase/isomerase family protein [Paremcibacter congregatus]|uniref:enoyl-CoA hydratase/isomerase family protein n=1 Tax=Paremcibacter congregatus TaxID=2043170 RepID=UPI0030ED61A3|tara:strand:+ start:727 stop:1782 length:1056 start_codon:yes stop_codon:yes gene_type:complete
MTSEAEILFEARNGLGIITLNRPKALNSLSTDMCAQMDQALINWAEDDAIKAVIIRGAGEKAFCAGGDVKTLAENSPEDHHLATEFFRTEYVMNSRIYHFPKPYIALLDGITMGGGVGVSVHGSHRIITEKTLFAMPESAIGLIPDVGGGYFMPRLPGKLGLYLGLTGARLRGADILYAGIGTSYMASAKLDDLIDALGAAEIKDVQDVDQVISAFAEDPGEASLDEFRDLIDAAFGEVTLEAVLDHLDAIDHPWAEKTLATLNKMSPVSMKVIIEQILQGAELEFDDVMKMEYRIVSHIVSYQSDFYEGVRAVLIDKDQNPTWNPPTVDAVTDEMVMAHFAPLGDKELIL